MGIFSDEDINEAEKLIKEELEKNRELAARAYAEQEKKRLRLEFLEGFEKGWKEARMFSKDQSKVDINKLRNLVTNAKLVDYLKLDINKNLKDFAYGFGLLVGMFRHDPTGIIFEISLARRYTEFVNALKDKPHYYNFIIKRVKIWDKRIKSSYWNTLNNKQKENYLWFLKNI